MIEANEFEFMISNPNAPLFNESGTCRIFLSSADDYFWMVGPGKAHRLYRGATDLSRLNAHWTYFSA